MSPIATTDAELSHAERRLLTADEVSRLLCVSRRTVHRLAAAGRLERIRLGYRTARYTPASVEALMSPENENGPAGNRSVPETERAGAPREGYTG